jgi:hypothetical protein
LLSDSFIFGMSYSVMAAESVVLFLERDVCDTSAWSLKWGTLMVYPTGLVYYYNRPMRDSPGRMQDVIHMKDVFEARVERMDWLVSKIFWVGRRRVRFVTREGEKVYYLRDTRGLFTALRLASNDIRLVDNVG